MLCFLSSGFVPRARRGLTASFQLPLSGFPQTRAHLDQDELEPLDNHGTTKLFPLQTPNNYNFKIPFNNLIVIRVL